MYKMWSSRLREFGEYVSGRSAGYVKVIVVLCSVLLALAFGLGSTVARAQASLSFGVSDVLDTTDLQYTSLQFGPDDRLYASDLLGRIVAYSIVRDGPNAYRVESVETIDLVKDIPNHNDDGTLNPSITGRLVTGLLVTGTSSSPVIYVASSDPRFGGGSGSDINDTDLDTNSTVLSRLTLTAGGWEKLDLVRGLPRSEENHHGNGLVLDPNDPGIIYLSMGGNTNAGATSRNFALLPEFALSAAILKIDIGFIGESTYLSLIHISEPTRPY